MNGKLITMAILIVLGVAALGFSQGWFTLSSLGPDTQGSKVSASQALDQDKLKEDAVEVTQAATEPADTATD
jgi:hypothetical protein